MKKTAILLAAIMVMSLSMTACNSNGDEGDYEEETTVSEVVENNDDEEETEAEASNGNKYENDIYSFELPEGWSSMEAENQVILAAPEVDGFQNNAVVVYKEGTDVFSMTEEQMKGVVEQSLGTTVTVNAFGEAETNVGTTLQFDYTTEKDGKTFTQTYIYVKPDENHTLTYLFTSLGSERAPECDSIYNTLTLK